MPEENPEEEAKIIIDEDWKTQVQREKEELKRKEAEEEESVADSDEAADSSTTEPVPEPAAEPEPLPPASMTFLITSLATQALASLGQFPGDDGQPLPVNLNHAKHFIDLLGVLEEKTKGNLDDQEKQFLGETLHQMRMMFVSQSN